jgi:site-specific DNA-adenine methylase
MTDYSTDDYLDGVVIESCDYKEVFQKFRQVPGVVFLADPPYLCTDVGTYRMSWDFADYLDVLTVLRFVCLFFQQKYFTLMYRLLCDLRTNKL